MADIPQRIIIAEDSPPNRQILTHLLSKLGFEVVSCEDGDIAWQALQESDIDQVGCIISDIMMPNMNGIELLEKVRGDDKFKDLPFLLVTAVQDKDFIIQAKDLNVTGYILKPVTFQRISAKLKEFFPDLKIPKAA